MKTMYELSMKLLVIALFSCITSTHAQGVISTKAGDGITEFLGDGGDAVNCEMASPSSLCIDATGNFYIADRFNHRIRKIDAANIITTIAGTGANSYTGDGGPALNATFDIPNGVALDNAGNLYVTEYNNHTIRKIDHATQQISTICGTGTPGYNGDGGLAINAQLNQPGAACLDAAGNIYIPDHSNNRIRKITAATGIITTIAGTGTPGYTGDGGMAANAQISYPVAVTTDGAGNVYFTDNGNKCIRKINVTSGIITTVAGNGTIGFSGDGGIATNATLNNPQGICLDAAGNLYIADYSSNRIRKVSAANNIITSVAGIGAMGHTGDGGPAVYGTMWMPMGLCTDANNNLFIAEAGNSVIRKVTPGVNAVNSITEVNAVTIYPNPSNGRFYIQVGSSTVVKIYNTAGQEIYELTANEKTIAVDLSAQPAGLYFIHTQTETGSHTDKIIIAR